MTNYIQAEREIDGDFTSLYFAMYMKGEWGIQVGYQLLPLWYVNMRKDLLDYQLMASVDCDSEYFSASQIQSSVIVTYPGGTDSCTVNTQVTPWVDCC